MKTKLLLLFLFLTITLQAQINLVPNGDFENWTTGTQNSEILVDNVSVINVAEPEPQYTLIPDLNFEKRLIELEYDSGTPDGKVLTSNIASVTSLSVNTDDIADLIGIQDFISLKTLSCTGTSWTSGLLTELDVAKNTALTSLDCRRNKIKDIDLSQNVLLQRLEIYSNLMSTLDVSKNLALEYLRCSDNQLTSLDVSKNLALEYLSCDRNQLSFLDVSKNLALKLLGCSITPLSSLDVSKNLALEYLICYDNALSFLDVSKNLNLTYLWCAGNQLSSLDVSKNLALNELACHYNQISSLDLSKNLALTDLWCSSNQLSSLDLSKNIKLTDLSCSYNQLTSLNLKNGNNSLINSIAFEDNFNLQCIQVDSKIYADTNWNNYWYNWSYTYSESCDNLSTSDVVFEKLSVYPNPTKGAVFIDNVAVSKVVVYDALGKLMNVPFTINGTSATANLEQFPKGIYYMYIESEGETTVRKIIVK
jgi:Leucine-rich repeat (LRR) protein